MRSGGKRQGNYEGGKGENLRRGQGERGRGTMKGGNGENFSRGQGEEGGEL